MIDEPVEIRIGIEKSEGGGYNPTLKMVYYTYDPSGELFRKETPIWRDQESYPVAYVAHSHAAEVLAHALEMIVISAEYSYRMDRQRAEALARR